MNNIERRDAGLPYISDAEVLETAETGKKTDTGVKYSRSFGL